MLLDVKNLNKYYGETKVLDDLSFRVQPQEILFLTGPSGCGKTTSLRLLSNLDVADSGIVLLDGQPSSHYGFSMWRTLVTYVPQSRTNMTGTPAELFQKVLSFSARSALQPKSKLSPYVRARLDASHNATLEHFFAVAESVGLQREQLEQNWSELSGGILWRLTWPFLSIFGAYVGQAQRANVALAIATVPTILLLDESTSSCDINSTQLVEQAVKNCGATVIWVSHDPSQPSRVGGRVYNFGEEC